MTRFTPLIKLAKQAPSFLNNTAKTAQKKFTPTANLINQRVLTTAPDGYKISASFKDLSDTFIKHTPDVSGITNSIKLAPSFLNSAAKTVNGKFTPTANLINEKILTTEPYGHKISASFKELMANMNKMIKDI